jgi:hypothetical protein
MFIHNQRGYVLLYVITGFIMAAALGLGMFYMTSTSTVGQAGGSGMNRAYFLALAGKDYALANWSNRSQLTGKEFTVSTTECFQLVITDFQITSTGIVNKNTPFEARKTITASPPSLIKKQFFESFENLTKWDTSAQVGGHAVTTVSGDKALSVTSTQTGVFGSRPWSFLELKTAVAGVDLSTPWKDAGYCLSHDVQVKISNNQPYHMEGINFKIAYIGGDREFYGVSFTRRKERWDWGSSSWVNYDNISNLLKPDAIFNGTSYFWDGSYYVRYSNPAIILWKRQGGTFTWLAYKLMTYNVSNENYVFNSSNLLVDWSNLQVRLVEAYSLGFTTGGPTPLLHGAVIRGGTSNASARISGSPIMISETWSSNTASGTLTLTNVSGTFQSGENLLVSGVVRAKVSGALGAKTNFIRVYYGDVNSHGTPNNNPTDNNRGSNPRIISGSSDVIHWPVDSVNDWNAANDYMTLVQWDGSTGTATILGGAGTTEANAIIQDSSLLTPNSGTIEYSGIALHATGYTATSTYFDDFAIQY